jgi:hypothetical protein
VASTASRPVGRSNGTAQGFATFNGTDAGTMMLNSSWVIVAYTGQTIPGITGVSIVGPFMMSTYEGTIAFTYTVTGDEFTITGSSDSGPANLLGVNDTLSVGAPTVNGTISNNSPPVLQTATDTPAKETWEFDGATFYAICLRTRTFTKAKATN